MATYVSNRDGGSTDEQGHYRFQVKVWDGNIENGMVVTQNSPLGMSVLVGTGDLKIDYSSYAYTAWNDANSSVTITTADGSNPRIDRIVAYIDRGMTPSVSPPNNQGMLKFMAVAGTPNAVPTRPSDATVNSAVGASNPWCDLANVLVGTGVTTIVNSNITDTRQPISLSISADDGGWLPSIYTPNTITANGNRSYDLVFNGTDLTDTITEGMRIRTTRTVAAPSQCATFDGTNDYFSKSSPAGMTFTDDFVVSAWVKLESYSTDAAFVSRTNGTQGWWFGHNSSGQIVLSGHNAAIGNYRRVVSYQSIPLNKWVHVSAQLDMSTYTATTTTCYTMIDGVDVPASLLQGGTNPTALVQAGDLQVGTGNSGTGFGYVDGKIAQVAIYSAKVTQATILASMNQGLTGSETSLVSAYSLSNSLEDLSANNNDLTANGGVLATTTDSPFGNSGVSTTIDYGIVMAKSFSTNTTLTVQVPEGCTIPTTGGVSSVDYSSASVPFGFPRDSGKWEITSLSRTQVGQGTPTINTWYNLGNARISVPIGAWELSFNTQMIAGIAGTAYADMYTALSSSTSGATDQELTAQLGGYAATQIGSMPTYKAKRLQTTLTTPYYLISASAISSAAIYNTGNTVLTARNAYL